jgi:2-keto-3-deoxy-L-rhamnonate aldolase RhmA
MGKQLKAHLAHGTLIRTFALGHLYSPKIVEMVGFIGGFEAVWFDQEHAGLTPAQIDDGSRAARAAGLDCFVRLPATDYATVMRVLEAGAGGVMASMVRSVAEVENLVSWAKFHPRGMRGVNGTGVDGRYGSMAALDYFAQANADTVIGVQIEHADALHHLEAIAGVPDVDFLFVGPADLSQSLGIPAEWEHPKLWHAIERVARVCRDRNLAWAILPIGPTFARRCVDMGCRMLSIGIDSWAMQRGLRAFQNEYEEFFPA